MTTNEPSTDLASPSAALLRAVGSRRISPVISWRQKKISITNTAMPNRMLYTATYSGDVTSTSVVVSNTVQTASNSQPAAAPMAWASQSNGAATSDAAASPAVSQTDEMMGTSHTPTGITPQRSSRLGWGQTCWPTFQKK